MATKKSAEHPAKTENAAGSVSNNYHELSSYNVALNRGAIEITEKRLDFFFLDPATWSYLAAILLTKMAEGFGTRFGEGIADQLLAAIFGTRGQDESLKKYLDVMTDRIISAFKQEILRVSLDKENANLAASYLLYEEYLRARRTSGPSKLDNIDIILTPCWSSLLNLGPAAVGSLLNAGTLRILVQAERCRRIRHKETFGNLIARIDGTINGVDVGVKSVKTAYDRRVVGPIYGDYDISMTCYRRAPRNPIRDRFSSSPNSVKLKKYEQLDMDLFDQEPYEERHQAYWYSVDNQKFEVPTKICNNKGNDAEMITLNNKCAAARLDMQNKFTLNYEQPFNALRDQCNKIKSEAQKHI